MTLRRFRLIARRAIERLPEELRAHAEDCMISFRRRPSRKMRRELEMEDDEVLYGLYEGPSLGGASHNDIAAMPPRIILFYEALVDDCDSEKELEREIHRTVLHEIGHHFGMDEEKLDSLGYG